MKSPRTYSIGRMVHYVPTEADNYQASGNKAGVMAAVIVATWEEIPAYVDSQVNLKLFTDGIVDLWRTSVPYSEDKMPGTWHWPELK